MINLLLAVAGGILGLAAAGGAAYAVWLIAEHKRSAQAAASGSPSAAKETHDTAPAPERTESPYPAALLRWTWLDYIVLAVSLFGFLLLLADVVAVVRDRDSYPGYHYPYLICGVLLAFMGMLISFLRLIMFAHAIRAAQKPRT